MASVLSLFSGCGGFDRGFEQAGFSIVEAHDKDPLAVETYNRNLRPVGRVTDLSTLALATARTDVIIAGPPCQGFSTIGSLRDEDQRNELVNVVCSLTESRKPRVLVLENVPGLVSHRGGATFKQAIASLQSAGYWVETSIVRGEEHGLPQRRRRLFLVARRGKRPFQLSLPTKSARTVGDALEAIVDPQASSATQVKPGTPGLFIARRIAQGQKLSDVRRSESAVHSWEIPEVFGKTTKAERTVLVEVIRLRRTERQRSSGDGDPVSVARLNKALECNVAPIVHALVTKRYLRKVVGGFELVTTFNGSYRRLHLGAPSPTVDTHFGSPRLFLHPTENRGLSHVEAGVLQGFDEGTWWPESRQGRFRLIGNAVPPPISYQVAQVVRELL